MNGNKISFGEMRKRKRGIFGIFDEIEEMFKEMESSLTRQTGGSGYSIQVTYDETGRPVVRVQTYGNVDKDALRKEIESRYPGAKIIGLEKRPLIEEITEETKEEDKK